MYRKPFLLTVTCIRPAFLEDRSENVTTDYVCPDILSAVSQALAWRRQDATSATVLDVDGNKVITAFEISLMWNYEKYLQPSRDRAYRIGEVYAPYRVSVLRDIGESGAKQLAMYGLPCSALSQALKLAFRELESGMLCDPGVLLGADTVVGRDTIVRMRYAQIVAEGKKPLYSFPEEEQRKIG